MTDAMHQPSRAKARNTLGAVVGGLALAVVMVPAAAPRPSAATGAEIVPADRRVDWSLAGIPGGVPVRETVCATIDAAAYGDGTTDATDAIQDAIDRCPPGQVVILPAGTYRTTDTVHLRTDKTLRGAGPEGTVIRYEGAGTRSVLDMRGLAYWDTYGIGKTYAIPAGAAKDARQLELGSVDGLSVGDVLLIDQLNDGVLVDNVGSEGACTYCSRQDGTRARGQYAEVTRIQGNVVDLGLPLFFALDPALAPQAVVIRGSRLGAHAGRAGERLHRGDGRRPEMLAAERRR
jgi:hypothetical protein